jgi:hypothetical protein
MIHLVTAMRRSIERYERRRGKSAPPKQRRRDREPRRSLLARLRDALRRLLR